MKQMKYNPYTKDLKCRVFDIETTGLNPSGDRIISASFIDPDGSGLVQFFTEDPSCEDFVISKILEELELCDCVITYNGNSFDLPFVVSRARKYGLAEKLPTLWKIDIYRWLKSYWQLAPGLESLRQKSVEQVLGLSDNRDDEIDGGECIQLYSEYIYLNRKEAKDLILLHNADDVRQLARITQQLSFLPYDRIAFEQGFYTYFETVSLLGSLKNRILIGPSELSSGRLTVSARSYPPCAPAAFYDDLYKLQSGAKGDIKLEINYSENNNLKYVDITKLPVTTSIFKDIPEYNHGYLILEDEDHIRYSACSKLILQLLEKLK